MIQDVMQRENEVRAELDTDPIALGTRERTRPDHFTFKLAQLRSVPPKHFEI